MAFAAALPPIHCRHPVRLSSGFSYRAAGANSPHAAPRAPKSPNKSWDDFYKRHSNKFFKDRHYLEKDWGRYFSVASEGGQSSTGSKVVLEVGCGAGNTIFPLRLAFPDVFVHACDFSHHAIALVKEHEAFSSDRVNAFVCDVTEDDLCKAIMPASVDIVTMEKLADKNQKISENFYARGDGTCAYYFSEDSLSTLFEENGFSPVEVSVYSKQIVNRSRKVAMNRRWIRATFCRRNDLDSQPLMISDGTMTKFSDVNKDGRTI